MQSLGNRKRYQSINQYLFLDYTHSCCWMCWCSIRVNNLWTVIGKPIFMTDHIFNQYRLKWKIFLKIWRTHFNIIDVVCLTSFTTQIKLATPHPSYLTNLPSSNVSVRRVCISIKPTRRQKLDWPPHPHPLHPKLKPEFIKLSPSIILTRKYLFLLKELEWILSNQNSPKLQWTVDGIICQLFEVISFVDWTP